MNSCECNEDLFQKCHICDPNITPDSKGHVRACKKCNMFLCNCEADPTKDIKNSGGVHYDNGGEDFLDRTLRTGTKEEILGAMRFTIGKYIDRLGKKDDVVDELTKMINYSTRYRKHLINKEEK